MTDVNSRTPELIRVAQGDGAAAGAVAPVPSGRTRPALASYIGRIGALAIALGVTGAAGMLATTPAVAIADDKPSAESANSVAAESNTDPTERTEQSVGTPAAVTESKSETAKPADDEAPADEAVQASPSEQETVHESGVIVRSSGGALTSGSNDDAPVEAEEDVEPDASVIVTDPDEPPSDSGRSVQQTKRRESDTAARIAAESVVAESGSVGEHAAVGPAEPAPAASPAAEPAPAILESAFAIDSAAELAPITALAPSADEPDADVPPTTILDRAVTLLGAALAPLVTADPAAPATPTTPLMWAVLGLVRRQSAEVQALEAEAPQLQAAEAVAAQSALPPDLERTVLVTGLESPTDMAFLPNGEIIIAQQNGTIVRYHDGHVHEVPVAQLNVNSEGERGLLGIEVDPDFDEQGNGYIYVSYTSAATNRDRLSRIEVRNFQAVPGTETVYLESSQAASSIHHGGEIAFDPEGEHLYWAVGDNIYAPNAQDLSSIHGKILRFNRDGSTPADNPFVGRPGVVEEIYAYGLRNPFRFDVAPNGTVLVGDVGSSGWEELNVLKPGANYGWPDAEGACTGCTYANPIYQYPHVPNGVLKEGSITSVLVYTDDELGPDYQNTVFIADYTLGWIKVLKFDDKFESLVSETTLDEEAGTTVKLVQGPDGKIYQLSIYPGELAVIGPSGGNRAPTAVLDATPNNGPTPLEVQFSAANSTDPDPDTTLTYQWDFGDGSAPSTDVSPTHLYSTKGSYTATLTVSDGVNATTTTQRIVVGNSAPTAVITTPSDGSPYAAGDTINFTGTGTDPDGDPLTYEWKVVFHHEDHVHPFASGIQGQSGSVVIPRTADNLPTTWYRIHLTVTDSEGLSDTTYVDVKPRIVDLTFTTSDPDATITIDGVPHQGTYTEQAVVGVIRTIGVPSPQFVNGQELEFSHWSSGQAQTHQLTTPGADASYTAVFDVVSDVEIEPFAIVKQVANNQLANLQRLAAGIRSGDVIGALGDIGRTTLTRITGAATALVSHGGDVVSKVFSAPVAVLGSVVDSASRIVTAIGTLDPLLILNAFQGAPVAIQGELSHQANVIGRSVDGFRAALLAAVSVPLQG